MEKKSNCDLEFTRTVKIVVSNDKFIVVIKVLIVWNCVMVWIWNVRYEYIENVVF